MNKADFDYIVAGGGTAGCVLANRLTENGRFSVLLIEAGGSASWPQILVPGLSTALMGNARWDWCYRAEPDPSRGGQVDIWPAGKVLGGGSSINGMVYLRGNAADYDDWEARGAVGWSYADCLPYFLKCESNQHFNDRWHGNSGPLTVSNVRADHPLNQRFLDACTEVGLKLNADVNGAEQEGIGRMQTNQRNGMRDSTARAYLAPARSRRNLSVMTHARVVRINIRDGRAQGVSVLRNGIQSEIHARHEVIISTGAMASPQLLMLSGIGPSQSLQQHGIETLADLPGVGANLQEHPGVIVDFEMSVPTLGAIAKSRYQYARAALQYLLARTGPASSPIAHIVGFIKTFPELSLPDVQFHFAPFSMDFVGDKIKLSTSNRVGVAINVCRPETRGRIRLRSAEALSPPVIEHSLFGSDKDMATVIRAGRLVHRIFDAEPLTSLGARPLNPPQEVKSDADWERFIRQRGFLMYHPVGTCRMGTDAGAVVDPRLRVCGVRSLRVVDASVMPTIPAANTNGPTIMLAEKAADLILDDASSSGVTSSGR